MKCPGCGDEYDRLGCHWRYRESHRPKLSEIQKETATGMLMGDAWVIGWNRDINAVISCTMINETYLEYIDELFGCLSTGVRFEKSAKENADSHEMSDVVTEDTCNDTYTWRSVAHPWFNNLGEWYSDSGKQFPTGINITPTVLKNWYVCDGSFKDNRQIRISMSNERENKDKIESYFSKSGLPAPTRWDEYERPTTGFICNAFWGIEESKELFDYMGEPLPGFEYKWPDDD